MDKPRKEIYMNNAATSWPRAPGVAGAVNAALEKVPGHPGRTTSDSEDVFDTCRAHLAELLGVADKRQMVLTSGATMSLNIAIGGMSLEPGDRVVTSVTEHNSVLRPLAHLEDRGVLLDIVGVDETGAVDSAVFQDALRHKPRLVVLNHVSNVTGRVQDVALLFAMARDAGAVTLLDASQSLGHIPVNAEKLCADMVAFTGHKALRGPAGTGGLYVAQHLELEPIITGGTGVRSDLRLHPADMPVRLEAGTPNAPGFAGLAVALRWTTRNGEEYGARERELQQRLRAGLETMTGITVYGEGPVESGIVSFSIKGWPVEQAGFVLQDSFGIHCRTGLHCAPLIHNALGTSAEGTIRLSLSGFNTPAEVDIVLEAVESIAACES